MTCACVANANRAREAAANFAARGIDVAKTWARRPEDLCSCPCYDPSERCSCSHCLSWLRRAPRCRHQDCSAYATRDGDCYQHDQERRARQRATASKRKPPRPPHEHQASTCSMCGLHPLPGRRRSWCSDECVELWNIAAAGQAAYAHLVQIHGQVCWGCGATDQDGTRWTSTGEISCRVPIVLEVEHVRPLWSLTDHERTQLRWWLPYNLQLLCTICHRAKSKREAGERAAAKRAAATAQGQLLSIEQGRPNVVALRP